MMEVALRRGGERFSWIFSDGMIGKDARGEEKKTQRPCMPGHHGGYAWSLLVVLCSQNWLSKGFV